MEKYNHQEIEAKWQKYWLDNKIYKTDLDGAQQPFYNLMMFPYPSAEGLHIGGMYTFTGVDTFGRYKRMKGYQVFEPMGLDAFGIHSENYALKIGEHIKTVSQRTEKHFYEQLHMMGNMYDWDHKLETNKEDYYKWTQWLFMQFFKSGLAYRKKAIVKFCPSCKTVLSDEQVIDSKCERCNSVVEDKALEQWFFKITKYADRLFENLKKIDWDQDVKLGQKNWINKKSGLNITYKIADVEDQSITIFTTRPDTNFGATFIVLAPEHDFVQKIITKEIAVSEEIYDNVTKYVAGVKNKSDIERISEGKEKTGVFTGYYCVNQLNNKKLPIWISDFVLGHFGTGAVVGVPAHDKRDYEFASKFGIEIVRVVVAKDGDRSDVDSIDKVQEDEGVMINSGFLDGMDIHKATEVISEHIAKQGWGEKVLNFNLRDWCVSRQRYWGPPIPMIYCENCANKGDSWFTYSGDAKKIMTEKELQELITEMKGWYPEESLPVKLPDVASFEAIKPDGSGRGPLASQTDFVNTTCPHCGGKAQRETDVSDPFVDSCWYFLRYPFTDFANVPFGGNFDNPKSLFKVDLTVEQKQQLQNRMKKWGPVNYYIGGKEHTVLHLLYARFITMALHDLGYLEYEEPFTKFYGHGLITKDGAKMSKSKGNVVNPDEYIAKYGADAVRLYLRFIGPFDQAGDWRDTGMEGMYRFVKKLWKIFSEDLLDKNYQPSNVNEDESKLHLTVKEVGEDLDELRYNTAVAHIMEFVNWYQDQKVNLSYSQRAHILEVLALLVAPLAPHIAEEFWKILGHTDSIHVQKWPTFDLSKTVADQVQMAIQINGKVRGTVTLARGADQSEAENAARTQENVKRYLEAGSVRKVIFVADKIVNFIIS
jgi:leucyl-tRNA synthetase